LTAAEAGKGGDDVSFVEGILASLQEAQRS
jgi:hypothetical protein